MKFFSIIVFLFFSTSGMTQSDCFEIYSRTSHFKFSLIEAQPLPIEKFRYEKSLLRLQKENSHFSARHNSLLKNIPFRKQVSRFDDIRFRYADRYRPLSSLQLIERYNSLDAQMREAILQVYNILNDPQYISQYLKEFYTEAFEWMLKHDKTKTAMNESRAILTPRAVSVTLIKRFKQRSDTGFTKLHRQDLKTQKFIQSGKVKISLTEKQDENAAFRAAVRSGPFIDSSFTGFRGHGEFSHMLQRDLVHKKLKQVLGNDSERFYEYLGSKKGVSFWSDLFDADAPAEINSFNSPENITELINKELLN